MSKKMWKVTNSERMLTLHCLGESRGISLQFFDEKDVRGTETI